MFSVIFDMDGTLLDTQKICVPAWEYAGLRQGFKGIGDCIQYVCGMNESGWNNYLCQHYPNLDIPLFNREMREYIIKNLKVEYKHGAYQLLEFLKKNNIKIALASGSSKGSIEHHLNEVNATQYFDAVVGGNDVENGKPAPDIFLYAAEKLDVKPETCFVFEDSANGIKAGCRAGMNCIGVPDLVPFDEETKKLMFAHLDSLEQAIELLKKEL